MLVVDIKLSKQYTRFACYPYQGGYVFIRVSLLRGLVKTTHHIFMKFTGMDMIQGPIDYSIL